MSTEEIFDRFSGKRILILGDIMLDRYLYGHVSRISPEAPVPVMDLDSVDERPGGAANVAMNLFSLGCIPILCGVVGNDPEARTISNALSEQGLDTQGITWSMDRRTTLKTRVIAQEQHLLRVDREDTYALSEKEAAAVKHFIQFQLEEGNIDAFVFQDYGKGLLSDELIKWCIKLCIKKGVPTLADPKKEHLAAFRGITLFKPNLKEARDLTGLNVSPDLESLKKVTTALRNMLDQKYTLITLSQFGLYIEKNGHGFIEPTHKRTIVDVCGAGDTVLSVAAAGLASQIDIQDIALLSNLAGGQVCEKVGVVPVNKLQLSQDFQKIKG